MSSSLPRPRAAVWLQCGRMLSPPARKTRAEVLDGILMAMRNTSNITEIPLGRFLHSWSPVDSPTKAEAGSECKGVSDLAGPWGTAEVGMRVLPLQQPPCTSLRSRQGLLLLKVLIAPQSWTPMLWVLVNRG